ncbi:MAG: hypothetical protein QOF76_2056 [Solirubrobacteraceae bacterium]|nr:hypothetical protein [Solirubrobacteraceae bacterium]
MSRAAAICRPVVVGFDVIEVDAAGRIGTVHGFIDHAPGM